MKRTLRLLTLVLLLTSARSLLAWHPHFAYVPTQGVNVYCFHKTADGTLWLGTNSGLFSYGRLTSNTPLHNSGQRELANCIVDIEADGLGRLWLHQLKNRQVVYNPLTNELFDDPLPMLAKMGIRVNTDFLVKADADGRLWIYNHRDIYVADFRHGHVRHHTIPAADGIVTCIATSGRRAAVLTEHALYLTDGNGQKLTKLTKTPIPSNIFNTFLTLSPQGDIWLSTLQQLFQYRTKERQWVRDETEHVDIRKMITLSDGRHMVATSNKGLWVYDSDIRHGHRSYDQSPTSAGQLSSSHLDGLFFDEKDKNLWVTYHKQGMGICNFTHNSTAERPLVDKGSHWMRNDVLSLCGNADGSCWLGTEDNGIFLLNREGIVLENRYPGQTALMIHHDRRGRLWTGMFEGGLHCDDGRSYFEGASVYDCLVTDDDRLFVLILGGGLHVLDLHSGALTRIDTGDVWMLDMSEDREHVYCCSPTFLCIIDKKTLKVERIPFSTFNKKQYSDGCKVLECDRRGWLWIVDFNNLMPVHVYDARHRQAYSLNELQQYTIEGICEDEHGNIWLTTNVGLVRVAVNEGTKTPFNFRFYPIGGYNTGSLYNSRAITCLRDNRLVLGTTGGYRIIDIKELEQPVDTTTFRQTLILTGLAVNGVYQYPNDSIDGHPRFNSSLEYLKELSLAYNENNLLLVCPPRDILPQTTLAFSYRLEGYSDKWVSMDLFRIRLQNLSPGDYRVMIREEHIGGHASTEYELLRFTIRPPFWQSRWAWLIYFLLISSGILLTWLYFRQRRRTLLKLHEMELKFRQQLEITPSEVEVTHVDQELLQQAIAVVEQHIGEADFSVDLLSQELGMHRTTLYNKLQAVTGTTPVRFIRLIRLKRAKQLLDESGMMVSQVAYQVGFNSPKKFAHYFKEEFGMLPSEYMKR